MGIRAKALIALILSAALIFLTISAILPIEHSSSSDFEFVTSFSTNDDESAENVFKGDKLPTTANGKLLSFVGLNEHIDDPAPFPSPSPDSDWDPLSHSLPDQKLAAAKANIQHATYEVLNTSNQSYSGNDDFRLLIGVMSPHWSAGRRHDIRNVYNQLSSDLPVDVFFVQGNISPWDDKNAKKVLSTFRTRMQWENDTFHDILHVECEENLIEGKTYEYFKKVGLEFSDRYTHVMKTDDDSFVNIPVPPTQALALITALVEVIKSHKDEEHFYWGTTWIDGRYPSELWGSGYILSMDLVKWIATSEIPVHNTVGLEDLKVVEWLIDGGLDDHKVINHTAFAGYPWPELGDGTYNQENEIRPFDRWTLVTHPLKEDFMWIETAEYYLSLEW